MEAEFQTGPTSHPTAHPTRQAASISPASHAQSGNAPEDLARLRERVLPATPLSLLLSFGCQASPPAVPARPRSDDSEERGSKFARARAGWRLREPRRARRRAGASRGGAFDRSHETL